MDPVVGIVITILGTVASVSGVALFVFNGTRKIIQQTAENSKLAIELLNKITGMLNNQDAILNKQTETLNKTS